MVDYLDTFGSAGAVPVDYEQRAVGVSFPDGAPAAYGAGDTLAFELSSLAMTGAGDVRRTRSSCPWVTRTSAPSRSTTPCWRAQTTTRPARPRSAWCCRPAFRVARRARRRTGTETGTSVWIPVDLAKTDSKISANAKPKKVIAKVTKPTVFVTVKSGGQPATGKVKLKVAGHTYKATLKKGKAEVKLRRRSRRPARSRC